MTNLYKPSRRGFLAAAASASAVGLAGAPAWAQDFPSRPVTMIVPWGAGGGTDATGRMISALLEKRLGQPFNVVNRTGGAGVIGHSAIATAPNDGYTLGVLMNADSPAITVSSKSDYQDIESLTEAVVNSEPGTFKASGTSQGGIWHLALVGWLQSLGLESNHVTWVPSEGSAPAMQDLIAGGVDIVTVSLGETKAMVDAGRAVNVALMGSERASSHPDVPTLIETGAADFALATWRGICGPKDMPQDAADAVSAALAEIATDPEFVDFMNGRGFNISYLDPAAHARMMADADAQMGDTMAAAGLIQKPS